MTYTYETTIPIPERVQQLAHIGPLLLTTNMKPCSPFLPLKTVSVWGGQFVFHQQHPGNASVNGQRTPWDPKADFDWGDLPKQTLSGHFLLSHTKVWFMDELWDRSPAAVPGDEPEAFRAISDHHTSIVFYEVGCHHHNQRERTISNCFHEVTCPDCGIKWHYDSGD